MLPLSRKGKIMRRRAKTNKSAEAALQGRTVTGRLPCSSWKKRKRDELEDAELWTKAQQSLWATQPLRVVFIWRGATGQCRCVGGKPARERERECCLQHLSSILLMDMFSSPVDRDSALHCTNYTHTSLCLQEGELYFTNLCTKTNESSRNEIKIDLVYFLNYLYARFNCAL